MWEDEEEEEEQEAQRERTNDRARERERYEAAQGGRRHGKYSAVSGRIATCARESEGDSANGSEKERAEHGGEKNAA